MLNSDRSPAKPAAMAAMAARWLLSSSVKESSGRPMRRPPKISCSIGDDMPMTPMPADTFMHSTIQISQNWRVLWASRRCTWRVVIMLCFADAGGVQPSGLQPFGGIR